MPIYVFKCPECGRTIEQIIQTAGKTGKANYQVMCPEDKTLMEQQPTTAAVRIK